MTPDRLADANRDVYAEAFGDRGGDRETSDRNRYQLYENSPVTALRAIREWHKGSSPELNDAA